MRKIFKFCAKYLSKKKGCIALYVVICILSNIISLLLPYISGNLLDQLVQATDTYFLINYIIIFSSLSMVDIIFGYVSSRMYIKLQTEITFELNADAISHIQKKSMKFAKTQDTSYITQKINNDSNVLITFCISVLQQIIINIIKFIVSLIFIFSVNTYLAIIMLVLNLIYFASYKILKKIIFKANYELKEGQAHFFGRLNEQLLNVKFIQMHGIEQDFFKRLRTSFFHLLGVGLKYQKLSYLFSSIDKFILILANIFIFLIGGISVINGSLSIGYFTIILSYFNIMMSSTSYLFMLGQSIQESTVSYKRLEDILSTKEQSNGDEILTSIESVTIKNLTFSYGDNCLYDDFNATFEKGKIYALTGENGSGKSTLIDIIVGLYVEEFTGEILYNEKPINQLDMIKIRKSLIAISEQEPLLLPDTFKYNITLNEQLSLDENKFKELCYHLNLCEFIDSLTDGLNTIITENSSNISGGEKQKISLMRAFLRNSSILILDEPTSALDKESQIRLMEYLCSICNEKIILISTHSKELINLCDFEVKLQMPNIKQ